MSPLVRVYGGKSFSALFLSLTNVGQSGIPGTTPSCSSAAAGRGSGCGELSVAAEFFSPPPPGIGITGTTWQTTVDHLWCHCWERTVSTRHGRQRRPLRR